MLWLCIALPQLPLEALHVDNAKQASVVTACEGSTRWVVCCNPAAELVHLKVAMNYNVALAMQPAVLMLERNLQSERATLQRLAAWAYQFSSTVILGEVPQELRLARTATLWLEIGASLKLFGGLRELVTAIEHDLQQLRYSYCLGIGPTLEGSALLARAGIRVVATTPHALCTRIRNLPIDKLALAPVIARDLHTTGVRTIGLLLELPRAALARRFGPELADFLDRLTGELADPRPVFQLPAEYDVSIELEHEVRSTEALLFILRRLLREFAGFLRARDTAVQHFSIALAHRGLPATSLHIGLSIAERDAAVFFTLVREHLERLQLPAATLALRLMARQFAAPATLQADFFSRSPEQTEPLTHTLDRIAARLGRGQLHALKANADHRPEASWTRAPLDSKREQLQFPERPLWLLPRPQPLQLSALPQLAPGSASAIDSKIVSGPERIEAGWWDGEDVQRDYYIVHTRDGADLWVYQDLTDRSWYLHGFWS